MLPEGEHTRIRGVLGNDKEPGLEASDQSPNLFLLVRDGVLPVRNGVARGNTMLEVTEAVV